MKYLRIPFLSLIPFILVFGPALSRADAASYRDELVAKARLTGLASDREWLNLVHYKKSLFGAFKSQVANHDFFLSPMGSSDPEKELEATIAGFFSPAPVASNGDSAQCRFPARFIWLDSRLHFDGNKLPIEPCPRFKKFESMVAAKSATVIFASYFLNNPSSAFGHTFLRLNKTENEGDELLDFGVNYAAEVDTGNALIYAFKGVAGMFHGTFTSMPFYYKVREYNDFESRDLWGYDLNLTPDQMKMLVAHVWELGASYFHYYYLTQNCSYHVLSVLDAADPDLHLIDRLPHFYVIPAETIKVLVQTPGLVKKVTYRPSVRTQLMMRIKNLNGPESDCLARVIEGRECAQGAPLPVGSLAKVYDAAMDYVDFNHAGDILLAKPGPALALKRKLLLARSELGVQSDELKAEPNPLEAPERGHGTIRAGLNFGSGVNDGDYSVLSWRFALHDLLDPVAGYPEYAQIEFLNADLRYYYRNHNLRFDDITLFSIESLSAISRFYHQFSWHFNVGEQVIRDAGCDHCGAAVANGGIGYTFKPFTGNPFYVFFEADGVAEDSNQFADYPMRLGVGPRAGLRERIGDNFVTMFSGAYHFYLGREIQGYVYSWQSRYKIAEDLALNLNLSRYPDDDEGDIGFFVYF